jgi:hypothetical protein
MEIKSYLTDSQLRKLRINAWRELVTVDDCIMVSIPELSDMLQQESGVSMCDRCESNPPSSPIAACGMHSGHQGEHASFMIYSTGIGIFRLWS